MTDALDHPAAPQEDWARPMLDRQLALLGRLAEVGLEVAVAIEAEVKSGRPFDGEAVARAYARTARTVRLTVLLQSKLIRDLKAAEEKAQEKARSAVDPETEAFLAREEVAKDRVARIVRRVITAEHDDEDSIERLEIEACERLDDEDCYGSVLTRPLSEMVADICQDLGLGPDWARLAGECWAIEEIDSGQVGQPLQAFARARPPPPAGEPAPAPAPYAAERLSDVSASSSTLSSPTAATWPP